MDAVLGGALDLFNLTVLFYFVILNTAYVATTVLSFRALRRYANRLQSVDLEEFITDEVLPPVTLLAPAYNEAATCVQSIRALLGLRHPDYEVLVVNDGSRDDTLDVLIRNFDLRPASRAPTAHVATRPVREVYRSRTHPNLWVVDKENGGKADALNAGLNLCRTPLFCAIDVDTLVERDALTRISRGFLEDRTLVATGGIIRIVNDSVVRSGEVVEVRLPKNLLARLQVLEYLRAFLAGRMGWDAMDATLVISGAFGMFRRSVVAEAGGYATDTVGEDMELVVRLRRYCVENGIEHRIAFVPDPVAWTECPETVKVLGRQRDRWQRGLIESLWRHRVMLFNPRYKAVGMVAFPYFLFLEGLGPIVEALGYLGFLTAIALGRASVEYVAAFLALAVVFGMALSVAAVALEELSFRRYPRKRDVLILLGLSLVDNLGYRQLSTWWRFRGLVSKLQGKGGWGAMERKGFSGRHADSGKTPGA